MTCRDGSQPVSRETKSPDSIADTSPCVGMREKLGWEDLRPACDGTPLTQKLWGAYARGHAIGRAVGLTVSLKARYRLWMAFDYFLHLDTPMGPDPVKRMAHLPKDTHGCDLQLLRGIYEGLHTPDFWDEHGARKF